MCGHWCVCEHVCPYKCNGVFMFMFHVCMLSECVLLWVYYSACVHLSMCTCVCTYVFVVSHCVCAIHFHVWVRVHTCTCLSPPPHAHAHCHIVVSPFNQFAVHGYCTAEE